MDIHTALLVLLVTLAVTVLGQNAAVPRYKGRLLDAVEDCVISVGASRDDVDIVVSSGDLTSGTQQCLQYCAYGRICVQDGLRFNRTANLMFYRDLYEGDQNRVSRTEQVVDHCIGQGKNAGTKDTCTIAKLLQQCYKNS